MNDLLIEIGSKSIRVAHLKNGKLHDIMIERKSERKLEGNIYYGKVTNVLPGIESAFINIDKDLDNGFIHNDDLVQNIKVMNDVYDIDFQLDIDISKMDMQKAEKKAINELLKKDQSVLVQVVKEPIGNKGARLTSNISIAGRYLVLLPNSSHRGVSRKIEDRAIRERLKKLIRSFEMPQDMGIICRTAAKVATDEMLIEEAHELLENWHEVMEKFQQASEPTLLHTESDLIRRSILMAIDKRFDRILIEGDQEVFKRCKRLYERYSNEHSMRVEFYRDKTPMYERFNVEREIEKSLGRKIWLPSGGYLYFDRTEAMYTIDVNSGRSSTEASSVEEALTKINMEAAEEIARQLRIRNIAGLIIIDFIDMRLKRNRRRVLQKLKEFILEADSSKCSISEMSDFCIVEMTRQRNGNSLFQTIMCDCPYCEGTGMIKNMETTTIELERALSKVIKTHEQYALKIAVHPQVYHYMDAIDKEYLNGLAQELNARIQWEADDSLHLTEFRFFSSITNALIAY